MVSISVKTDVKRVTKELGGLHRDLRDKATVMAINKTLPKMKTEEVRAISSEYNIKQADVRSRIRIIRARRGKLYGEINPFASSRRGRSLNLIHFMERKVTLAEGRRRKKSDTQNVLRFKIKKKGGLKTIRGAFIGNKGRTIFRRTGKGRLPIEAVSTIDVPQMFNTRRIVRRVVKRGEKEFPIEYGRAARRVIARFNR